MMKNKLKNILLFSCCLDYALLSSAKGMQPDDPEFERNFYTLHCVGHYYKTCVNRGSTDPDRTRDKFGPSFEDSIKFLFTKRMQEEDFSKAYGIFQNMQSNLHKVEPIMKDAYVTACGNFNLFARDYTKQIFENYLKTNQLEKAYSLAKYYYILDQKLSDEWVERVRKGENIGKPLRILSIDGGGIRGLIPAVILDHIEETLKENLGASIRIAEFFDVVAGTSTGGIIALGLNVPKANGVRPRYPAKKLVDLYENYGSNIFPPSTWIPITGERSKFAKVYDAVLPSFPVEPLEKKLDEYFIKKGKNLETLRLQDSFTRVFIAAYNTGQNYIHYFDSKNCGAKFNYSFKDVGLSTSAAPTYLREANIKDENEGIHTYVDGGMFANNPALAALLNIKNEHPNKNFFVCSLGTGESIKPVRVEGRLGKGMIHWAYEAPEVLMRGANAHNHQLLSKIADEYKQKYYRIQTVIPADADDMANAAPSNIKIIKNQAEKVANGEEVKVLIKDLIFIALNGELLKARIERNIKHSNNYHVEGELDLSGIPLNGDTNLKIFDDYLIEQGIKIKKISLKFSGITRDHDTQSNNLEKVLKILCNRAPKLEYLNLAENSIETTAHIEALKDFLSHHKNNESSFEKLILSKNKINDVGLKKILLSLTEYNKFIYVDLLNNKRSYDIINISNDIHLQRYVDVYDMPMKEYFYKNLHRHNNSPRKIKVFTNEQTIPKPKY